MSIEHACFSTLRLITTKTNKCKKFLFLNLFYMLKCKQRFKKKYFFISGLFLYWSADDTGDSVRLEIESPVFEAHTLPTCALQMSLHMWQMNLARFQVVIKAPNSTWESTRFEGSSAHE